MYRQGLNIPERQLEHRESSREQKINRNSNNDVNRDKLEGRYVRDSDSSHDRRVNRREERDFRDRDRNRDRNRDRSNERRRSRLEERDFRNRKNDRDRSTDRDKERDLSKERRRSRREGRDHRDRNVERKQQVGRGDNRGIEKCEEPIPRCADVNENKFSSVESKEMVGFDAFVTIDESDTKGDLVEPIKEEALSVPSVSSAGSKAAFFANLLAVEKTKTVGTLHANADRMKKLMEKEAIKNGEGEWICAKCSAKNIKYNLQCEKCHAMKRLKEYR